MRVLLNLVVAFSFFFLVISQSTDSSATNDTVLDPKWSYCFEFTWFGPQYEKGNMYNGTCADYLDSSRATNVPCSAPVVISEDGTPPDIDWMFENKRPNVLCRRTENQVCATYTYKYAGVVNNATYMCTKVQEVGSGAITSGCYTQSVEGYDIDLCVCKSDYGLSLPCNGKF
ncbi:hypothetical protein MTP99_012282 [Tenebrio molitor]|jgi:hypothetical protein|uniref:uncharacterized protein n=1 Tax=Tenebrio molitor TaxID=7067 RepID=UPI001C3A32C5|nr:hypothetical protein MTP99_012282 [Tenebrio molitor]CAH1370744.1 unnamed protein product [Tenebrio molitor]